MKHTLVCLTICVLLIFIVTVATADTVGFNGPSEKVSGTAKTKNTSASQQAVVPVSSMQNLTQVWFWVNRGGSSAAVSYEYIFTAKTNRALYRQDISNPVSNGETVTSRWKSPTNVASGVTMLVHYTWTP